MMCGRSEASYNFVAFGKTFELVSDRIIAATPETMREIVWIEILNRRRVGRTHSASRATDAISSPFLKRRSDRGGF